LPWFLLLVSLQPFDIVEGTIPARTRKMLLVSFGIVYAKNIAKDVDRLTTHPGVDHREVY